MKYALINVRSGEVAQWQDTELAAVPYPAPVQGMELHELPDDFEFPVVPTWLIDGVFVTTRPEHKTAVIDSVAGTVLQWRNWLDHDYAELVVGTEEIQLPGDFVFPEGETWYRNGVFTHVAPPPPPSPPPTAEQVMAQRNAQLDYATQQINPLQDLVDIGDATAADEAKLLTWKKYRAAVGKVQTQPGFPASVIWPDVPSI